MEKKVYMSFTVEQIALIRASVMKTMLDDFSESDLIRVEKDPIRCEKEVKRFAELSSIVAQTTEEIEKVEKEEDDF